jgi:hypothetical protein
VTAIATWGVSLHPEKTRIVHVTNGFEFLGYKIGKGKGLKLPAHKRTARTNPLGMWARVQIGSAVVTMVALLLYW